jgi:hypothetical protein
MVMPKSTFVLTTFDTSISLGPDSRAIPWKVLISDTDLALSSIQIGSIFGEDAVTSGAIKKNNAWSICFMAIIVLSVLMPTVELSRRFCGQL